MIKKTALIMTVLITLLGVSNVYAVVGNEYYDCNICPNNQIPYMVE